VAEDHVAADTKRGRSREQMKNWPVSFWVDKATAYEATSAAIARYALPCGTRKNVRQQCIDALKYIRSVTPNAVLQQRNRDFSHEKYANPEKG
jgi:type IV secretory pathway TrbF-like protein